MNVNLSNSGSLVAGQWTTLTNGSLSVSNGTYSFNLTDFDGSSAYVYASGNLTLGSLAGYANETGNYEYFWSQGDDAALSLPELTALYIYDYLVIRATDGGEVSASSFGSVTG